MYVQTDQFGIQQLGVPITAAVKKPVVTPAKEGDRSQEDRRQQREEQTASQDSRPVFRSLLTESTLAGLNASASNSTQDFKVVEAIERTEFVRAEKRPAAGPASISGDETSGLFDYLSAARSYAESTQAQTNSAAGAGRGFVEAAARYAEQSFAATSALAGRGETLELQA